ncbi:MAG: 1,6-anhydro-N-acetylmuramyl-L-alanine amidase AmpD [Pseudomonadota bacterium]
MSMTASRIKLDIETGLASQARQCASPNFDRRPDDTEISLVVLHGISLPPGEFGGDEIEQFFCNCLNWEAHDYFEEIRDLIVSSHFLIRRDGELLQFVPTTRRAWHAGQSSYNGRSRCNDFSIGIELEGTDDIPYTDAQYDTLVPLISALIDAHPEVTANTIAGHSDISPGRKTDPGPVFDWLRLYDGVDDLRKKATE